MGEQKLIAWSPTIAGARVGAVLCSPQKIMDRDIYLSLLGDRIQRMVNLSEDPEFAAREFADIMERQGLWYSESVPVDEVGNDIVWSNPAAHEYLSRLGLLNGLKDARIHEMSEAREQIDADADDPYVRLIDWAGMLTTW